MKEKSLKMNSAVKSCIHWAHFNYVIIKEAKYLLEILHDAKHGIPRNPRDLYYKLQQFKSSKPFSSLRGKKVLNHEQWQMIFPTSTDEIDSSKFDVTLIVFLIQYCTTIPKPKNGWRRPPSEDDYSMGACLLRFKNYRNKQAHIGVKNITTNLVEIEDDWEELCDILKDLNPNFNSISYRKSFDMFVKESMGVLHCM